MADTKVSALSEKTSLDGTEEFPVNDSGTSKKVSTNTLQNFTGAAVDINQVAHPFTVDGEWAEFSAGGWALAQADDPLTLASAVIVDIPGVDDFRIVPIGGAIVTIPGHAQGSAGDVLYLSQAVPGGSTSTKPTTGLIQQVATVIDANTLLVQSFNAEYF